MNVANNINGMSNGIGRTRRRRPISVIQLAMALVFIALPATVLFPIIATPVVETTIEAASMKPYMPTRRLFASEAYAQRLRQHWHNRAMAAWHDFAKYSATHGIR